MKEKKYGFLKNFYYIKKEEKKKIRKYINYSLSIQRFLEAKNLKKPLRK